MPERWIRVFVRIPSACLLVLLAAPALAGPPSLVELLNQLQNFLTAQSDGISSQDLSLFNRLVNNARVGISSGASAAATDKALEAIGLLLRRLRDGSETSGQQMARDEAFRQLEGIRDAIRDQAADPRFLDPFDPEPIDPLPENCSVEILQVVRGSQLGRIVNGRFTLQAGSVLDLQAQGSPGGGMTRWELDPVPQDFDNGGFSTSSPNCPNCGDGNLRFLAPTGPGGRTSYRITAIYTSPTGLICRDQLVVHVR